MFGLLLTRPEVDTTSRRDVKGSQTVKENRECDGLRLSRGCNNQLTTTVEPPLSWWSSVKKGSIKRRN